MKLDLNLLQCAVLVAQHRNFGRAAAVLGITQPALSRRVAALERQAGIRIFERSPGAIRPTTAGAEFLTMAQDLVTRAAALSNKLDLMRTGRAGHLRVAVGIFIADLAVNAAIPGLIGANPDIQLELLEVDGVAALNLLMTDRVDVAFLDITILQETPSIRLESLGEVSGRYVCRTGHPLLALESIQPEDIQKYPMAFPRVTYQHATWLQDVDSHMMIDRTSGSILSSLAVSSCRLMYEIVASSDTISVAHPSQVKKDVEGGRLALFDLPWQEKSPSARFGMIYRQDRTLPPAGHLLLSEVRKIMRRLQASAHDRD